MKKAVCIGMIFLFLGAFLGGCGHPVYKVTMKDGTTYEAKDRPNLDNKSEYLEFTDLKGKKMFVKEADVATIGQE